MAQDFEKGVGVYHDEDALSNTNHENADTVATAPDMGELDPDLHVKTALRNGDDMDEAVVRKLLWKIDLRLITALSLLYALCLIDRSNLAVVGFFPVPDWQGRICSCRWTIRLASLA